MISIDTKGGSIIVCLFHWFVDIRDDRESKATAKLQNYIGIIQKQYQKNLDGQIDQEVLCDVAKNLRSWHTKYNLLELDYDEVKVIQEDNSSAISQRKLYNSYFEKNICMHILETLSYLYLLMPHYLNWDSAIQCNSM